MTASGTPRLEARAVDVPCLAWCAEVEARTGRVALTHGAGVEVRDGAFFEGAWNGNLAAGRFDAATVFTGSGGRPVEDGFVFATSTDTLERLQWLRKGDRLLISNSLAFLLRAAGESLDPRYPWYVRDLGSIQLGLRRCRSTIPTRSGRTVHLLHHCNALVRPDLRVERRPKPEPAPFETFEAYEGFLVEGLRAVHANATDPDRKRRYRPLAMVSSGYDAPACAALARAIGCDEAIVVEEARTEYGEFRDPREGGAEIASRLGLAARIVDRHAWRRRDRCPEAEFLATGCGGSDVVFGGFEPLLPGRLLVSGFYGDSVWWRRRSASPDVVRGDSSGASLGEFRLRTDYLQLAVPFMGCTRLASINAITRSRALRPWSVGGAYDRPIPRRIVEEAGVPRELFGREKKAIAHQFSAISGWAKFHDRPLEQVLTPSALASFRAWLAREPHAPPLAYRARFALGHLLWRARLPLSERSRRRLERRGLGRLGERWLRDDPRWRFPITVHDYTTQWAVAEISDRYAAADLRGA
jgi:hypothetical protein